MEFRLEFILIFGAYLAKIVPNVGSRNSFKTSLLYMNT